LYKNIYSGAVPVALVSIVRLIFSTQKKLPSSSVPDPKLLITDPAPQIKIRNYGSGSLPKLQILKKTNFFVWFGYKWVHNYKFIDL